MPKYTIKNSKTGDWLSSFKRPYPGKNLGQLAWTGEQKFAIHFNEKGDAQGVIDRLPKRVEAELDPVRELSWPEPDVNI
jgi:hypothetical protein